jgi:hypothetical protein
MRLFIQEFMTSPYFPPFAIADGVPGLICDAGSR